ncbi:ATP-binding protein [Streptomyces californicus]
MSDAFYPYTPFRSGTDHGDRKLSFGVASDGSGPDRVLDEAAESGWGLLELPARHTPRTDPEAVRAVALVVRRLLDRGGVATSERADDPVPVTADRVAVGTAHRDQAAAVRAALAELGVTGVAVDTANRLQGREFDVTVVLDPLSGRPDATAFHLETGLALRPGVPAPARLRRGVP